MIYLYKSISPQAIESLHKYMDFFYAELFKNKHSKFDQDKLISKQFFPIAQKNYLNLHYNLREIYRIYSEVLTMDERKKLILVYKTNNRIKEICNKTVDPYKYNDLPDPIRQTIDNLYGSEGILWKLISAQEPNKEIIASCNTLKDHFDDFRRVNYYTVCPFCGIDGLLNEKNSDYKDDYDHLLSKGKYPFISINFDNLFPMCDKCNKKYKSQSDPVFSMDVPPVRRAFYHPYETIALHQVNVSINSNKYDLRNKETWDLNISCLPKANEEKKNTWIDVFKIRDRYMAIIAKDSWYWKDQVVKKYFKQKKGNGEVNFQSFSNSILDNYENIAMIRGGVTEKCFYEFLLHDPDFENNINGTINF